MSDAAETPELEAARRIAPLARAAADETERGRRLAPAVVSALGEAGLFSLCVPRRLGGCESDPRTVLAAIEEIARADGAAGWCLMIAATTGLVGGYLPEAGAREVFADPARATGGVLAPLGFATVAEGGYRASGRWAFGSGCEHSAWLVGGCVVVENGAPRRRPDGSPELVGLLVPTAAATIHDTWDVAGLRGTGSHDFELADVFVPESRVLALPAPVPREPGPLYAFPLYGLLAVGIAAVALGLAGAAIEELVALAATKTPSGSRRLLRERSRVQADVAAAEARLGSSRAYLHDRVERAFQLASRGGTLAIAERAGLRLAATHATRASVEAVDLAYEAAGGSAVYARSPLQRIFRDAHVVTQHVMVAPATLELVGRIRLGLEADVAML